MPSLVISLVVLGLVGLGGYALLKPSEDAMMKDESMMQDTSAIQQAKDVKNMLEQRDASMQDEMEKDDMMKKDEPMMMDKGDSVMAKGTVEAYSPEKLALAGNGKVVLFFHAAWCPKCRQLDAEAAANPGLVPNGVHVLKVDYDTATALKQKYGVTVQHTFVQVDAQGNAIQKFSDATTYAQVFGRVK